MPVCRGMGPAKIIRYVDDNVVSFVHDKSRTKVIPVVSESGNRASGQELCRSLPHDQIVSYLPVNHCPR